MTRGVRTRTVALLAAVVLAGVGAAGCGDDSGGAETPDKTPQAQTSEETSPTEEETSPTEEETGGTDGGQAGGAPEDAEAAEKEVRANWKKFFAPATAPAEKQKLLEDGEQLKPLMDAFSGDKRMGQVGAVVDTVEFTSPEEAEVTYDLTLKGETVVPGSSGVAVLQDGTWKVSKKSLCGLIGLSGSPAPGC